MTSQKYSSKILLNVFLITILSGCGASKQQAMLDTINSPQDRPATFVALSEDLKGAENEQVNLIAPEGYMHAQKLYLEAKKNHDEGKSEEKTADLLKESRSELDSAVAFSRANKDSLAPLMRARETTLSLGTTETASRDVKKLEDKYLLLVRDLDRKDKRRNALERISELTDDYKKLTVETIQNKFLGEAEVNLKVAKKEDAEDMVPKTFKETVDALKKAKDYIAHEQGSTETSSTVAELGNAAAFASRRLLVINRQAHNIEGLSPEDISLKTEALLNAASVSLSDKDFRDLSFESHASALNETIAGNKGLQNTLAKSREKLTALETKTENYSELEQRQAKNDKFEEVRKLFNEDEAKVYRQGNNLVISLKQIQFPVNKSDIPAPSYGLLKKVQEAIKAFDEPNIVVEGHTDSTGTAELNKLLSEQRAEAVKAYLLSNSVIGSEKVEAVGYGSERPLASNQSGAGRATNRRIDVIIKN